MRALPVAVVSILLGGAVGAGSAYWSIGPERSASEIAAIRGTPTPNGNQVTAPQFHVDQTQYDFGTMERGTSREHSFQVTNKGTAPLTIEVVSTTCKCTAGDVGDKPVPPGETVPVTLSWTAKTMPGEFRQTATLRTNDPRTRRIELTVEGMVTDVSGVEPKEWFFDNFRPGDDRTESVYVMSYKDEDLVIESAQIDYEDDRDKYKVDFTQVPKDELPDAAAKSGYRVDVTPLANVPLGPMQDWVVLKTNIENADELRVPILGTAVGDIEIRGPSEWNDVTSSVHFGEVQSADGAEVHLFLAIKGDHVEGTKFEVAECDPDYLKVEFGEPRPSRDGAIVPMTVRIPSGLPPAIRNGSGMGEAGRVVLKTNHPLNPEISFGVRFIIKQASVTR